MDELNELLEKQAALEVLLDNFFNGEPNPNYGDRGFQELLVEHSEIGNMISQILT